MNNWGLWRNVEQKPERSARIFLQPYYAPPKCDNLWTYALGVKRSLRISFAYSRFGLWSVTGTYPLISPIQAPFMCSGRLFDTNSGKTSTIVLGFPRFSVRSVIGGNIEAGNDR
jgi:hypothetical protein